MMVRLRHGVRLEGAWHREAAVRPITGADEARLAELADAPETARATALAAATTSRMGGAAPSADDVRALAVGDRERLLMALYRVTFGPAIDAIARCGAAGCGAAMDLTLSLDELLTEPAPAGVPAPDGEPSAYETTLTGEHEGWRARFRLPTGGDLEAAGVAARVDPGGAADLLVEQCVLEVSDREGRARGVGELGPDARQAIGEAARRLDPCAETTLQLTCPACGASSTALFDVGPFLLATLGRPGEVFEDVHRLARAYRWSEADILALPVARRRRYLELVAADREPA